MVERGYTREFADKTFSQIEGFGSYGFPESHAASFALIAYASAWMKCHHPDVFCCALLNAQPMGFYATAQIVRDAACTAWRSGRSRVNEFGLGLHVGRHRPCGLGLRMVKGLARNRTPTKSIASAHHAISFHRGPVAPRLRIPVAALERLAEADAFQALGLDRRQALWAIRGLSDTRLPLFDTPPAEPRSRTRRALAQMTAGRQVVEDYRSTGLSLRRHPVSFLRPDLAQRTHRPLRRSAATIRDGRRVEVAGIMLVRQRPGSARGVLFVTIEDETGHANLILWPSVFEAPAPPGAVRQHDRLPRQAAARRRGHPRDRRTDDRPVGLAAQRRRA